MSHVTLLCTVCEVAHHSLSKSLSILLLSLTLLRSVQLTLQEVLKHSDLFAGIYVLLAPRVQQGSGEEG